MKLFKSKEVVGVDIGTSSVKLVELTESKKGFQLQNFAVGSIPSQAIVDGAIMDAGAIVDSLQGLLREHKIKRTQAAMGLSGHSVIVKKISLPEMSEEELEESIHWEAEQYIPFDIDDVNLDFQILETGEATEEGKMDVLLVAVKKDKIDDYTSVLIQAGLTPAIVDLDAFALQNSYEISYEVEPDKNIALVNVGAGIMNINVLRDGMSTFTRDISVGGNQFTEAIQKEMHVSIEDAERLKMGETLPDVDMDAFGAIIGQINETLSVEIQRSFDFFRATSADQEIDQIILSGGCARISNLDGFLKERLNMEVEINNPFRNIDVNEKKFDSQYISENAPLAAVGIGLALRKVGDR
jgi:type IV pilus assembly protein PilM